MIQVELNSQRKPLNYKVMEVSKESLDWMCPIKSLLLMIGIILISNVSFASTDTTKVMLYEVDTTCISCKGIVPGYIVKDGHFIGYLNMHKRKIQKHRVVLGYYTKIK